MLSNVTSYVCGAGADVLDIQSVYGKPDEYDTFGDFEAFWTNTLSTMNEESESPEIQFIHHAGTVTKGGVVFDCYELEITCPTDNYYNSKASGAKEWCGTNHVMAYLTIPQGQTDLGLYLDFKGYDWISASGIKSSIAPQQGICNSGKITLSVSPHSIPAPHNVAEADVNDTTKVSDGAYNNSYYNDGGYLATTYGYTSSHGKNLTDNADPNTTYFKYMIMRDVQAARFLMKYFASDAPEATNSQNVDTSSWAGKWNGTDVKTNGASQGGYQAIAVAALVPEVNEIAANVPWFGDQGAESSDSTRYKPTSPRGFGYCEGLRYVDTANFASTVDRDCVATIKAGLIDSLVPPSTIMSIYDNLNCETTLTFQQNRGHSLSQTPVYQQTISKNKADTAERYINFVGSEDAFDDTFKNTWTKVSDEAVVTDSSAQSIDIYVVDKSTSEDFASLAQTSTADAIGVVLTGTDLDKINDKLAEIWALSNDASSKVWVIGNSETANAEDAAITLDACMNGGDRSTVGGEIELYGVDGKIGQSFLLGSGETNYAIVPTPLWAAGQVVWTETENVNMSDGKMSASADSGNITIKTNAHKASFDVVGALDADNYGNIDGVGFWLYNADTKTLTIKGAGDITAAPWSALDITKVELSEGIEALGADTFNVGVVEVTLPTTITSIDDTAFTSGSTIAYYDNCAAAKAFAEANADTYIFTNAGATGTCGDGLSWIFNVSTGVLTIDGTGATVASGASGWSNANSVWKAYNSSIKKVVICDSVTTIEESCFFGMSEITEVEISKNLNTIKFNAFAGCTKLTTINVRDAENVANTLNLQYVTSLPRGYQFDGAKAVTNVILSDKLTGAIGDKAFCDTGITSLTVPVGVTSIADRALYHYITKTPIELTVYGKDTVISENFLFDIDTETGVNENKATLSKIYTVADSYAYDYAVANSIPYEIVEEPEVVIASGTAGVDLNWKITNVDEVETLTIYGTGTTIQPYDPVTGALVTSIAWNTDQSKFEWSDYYGTAQKLVIAAPNVNAILGYTFADFDQIHTVELADTITALNSGSSFNSMAKLATVYSKGQTPVTGTANLSNIVKIGGYAFAYALFDNVIFADNVNVGEWAFTLAPNLREVTIPAGSTFGTGAFGSNTANKVTTVTFAEELATVSYTPFRDYKGTTNTGVTTITVNNPNASFADCTDTDYSAYVNNMTALTTVKGYTGSTAETFVIKANEYFAANSIDRTLTFVALDAGDIPVATGSCEGVTWTVTGTEGDYVMTLEGNVVSLPEASSDWGWDNYKNGVTRVVVSAPITSINATVKDSFANIETLELPESCTQIKEMAFNMAEKTKLNTVCVTGHEEVAGTFDLSCFTSIPDYAVVFCQFDKLILGENVNVNANAFFWNKNLTELLIPEGAVIGNNSFVGGVASSNRIWKLSTITFPKSMSVVPSNSFKQSDGTKVFTQNTCTTTIVVNNTSALFAASPTATANDYATFLTDMSALTTVKGYIGSTAEDFVNAANIYFADNGINRNLKFEPLDELVANDMPIGENLWFRIIDNKDEAGTYTMDIYGTGTSLVPYFADGTPFTADSYKYVVTDNNYISSNYKEYLSKISMVRFSTNVDSIGGYSFFGMSNLTTVELHEDMDYISVDAFNGPAITTLYSAGQTPVAGVANFSNVPTIEGFSFNGNKFAKIILSESMTTINGYSFSNSSALKEITVPASVTSIKNYAFLNSSAFEYIKFEGSAVTFDTATNFNKIPGYATVIAPAASTGSAFAEANGLQFIENVNVGEIVYTYRTDNSVLLISKPSPSSDTYTAFATGSATSFKLKREDGTLFNGWTNAVNKPGRPWDTYKAKITKLVYVNQALTAIDASFAKHGANLVTIEIPASLTTVGSNAFNGTNFKTLYVAGSEVAANVCDFTNITAMGDMCLASCASESILLSDDLTGQIGTTAGILGQNMLYQCANLTYIRIPSLISALNGMTFNGSKKLTTVLIENPDISISSNAFNGCTALSTIISWPGSTAEAYATEKGLTFIPISAENILSFTGFQVRTEGINGLRSLYTATAGNANSVFTVVEYGALLAATARLESTASLTVAKNASGSYETTQSFARIVAVYKASEAGNENGGIVGKTILNENGVVEYAFTLVNFSKDNYNKEVTARGYLVLADAEGHEYVVYADRATDAGESLKSMCMTMYNDAPDVVKNYSSYKDVIAFDAATIE